MGNQLLPVSQLKNKVINLANMWIVDDKDSSNITSKDSETLTPTVNEYEVIDVHVYTNVDISTYIQCFPIDEVNINQDILAEKVLNLPR